MKSFEALEVYLKPISILLSKDGISEISINEPNEAWVERRGDMFKVALPGYDTNHLKSLARLIAESTDQKISEETPLLSATLPAGYRIQVVFPPACENHTVIMSIPPRDTYPWQNERCASSALFFPAVQFFALRQCLLLLLFQKMVYYIWIFVKSCMFFMISCYRSYAPQAYLNMFKEVSSFEEIYCKRW